MKKAHLGNCPACARHVRVSEINCPFCGVVLEDEFRAQPARKPPAARLSRAMLYAIGAGSVAAAAACTADEAGTGSDYGAQDAYGGPPADHYNAAVMRLLYAGISPKQALGALLAPSGEDGAPSPVGRVLQ